MCHAERSIAEVVKETFTALRAAHTCPPTPLRYGDAPQWRAVPGSVDLSG
jgi:hypothetical protein